MEQTDGLWGRVLSAQASSVIRTLPIVVVLLLAFASRVYHLDFQSLWGDEGISLLRASLPFDELMRTLPREHVPGYWLGLRSWLSVAGTTDFALRYLSVLPSVLAIAVAYRLAADLGSRRAGLVAALLLATSAFQVWYAQEARMYSWLSATGIGSTWLLWRLLNTRKPALPFVGYVLLVLAGINLHFYGFLIPLAHTVFATVWLVRRRERRVFLRWAAASFVVLVLCLPWCPRLVAASESKGCCPALDPTLLPWRLFSAYTVSDAMPGILHAGLPWVYLILTLAGVWVWFRRNPLGGWLLFCAAFVPLAATFSIAVVTRGYYHERYAITLSVPLVMLAGAGLTALDTPVRGRERVDRVTRWRSPWTTLLSALILCGLVGANFAALARLRADSSVQKADFRALARRIEDSERPGDVIFVHGLDPREVFLHYYRGQLPVQSVQQLVGCSDDEVGARLAEITREAQRAWVLHYDPPTTAIESWLAGHAWLAERTRYGNENLTLSVYGLPTLPQCDLPQEIAFGPELRLVRAVVAGGSGEGLDFRAGDLVGITTIWDALSYPANLKLSLRLLDDERRAWLSTDSAPFEGLAPKGSRQRGQQFEDRMGFVLPADLPPGSYELFLMLYDAATGVPMGVGERDGVTLASIGVAPAPVAPDPDSLPISARVNRAVDDQLELLGYSITPQPLRPGLGATLALWWRFMEHASEPYRLRVQAKAPGGQVAFDGDYALSRSPIESREPGQVVRQYYDLALDPASQSGVYQLSLTVAPADGLSPGATLDIGTAEVVARARSYQLPRIANPLGASLGNSVLLRGYDLTLPRAPGGDLKLTLYWQASGRVPGGYKVFVHLVDDAGRTAAQADAMPGGGLAPTESWQPGEVIRDKHSLSMPGAGRYHLLVGLYDPATGERLPALDDRGHPIHENAISLEDIEIP